MTSPNSADALFAPPAHRHVAPGEEPFRQVPRLEKPVWPSGPAGPWSWPALEDARDRHLAALEALKAARESDDTEAERDALLELAETIISGTGAVRATHGSAIAAYKTAIARVRASIPTDAEGVIPGHERDRALEIKRQAGEWTLPDKETIRRCWSLTEPDTFRADGSGATVASIVAEAERLRESLVGGHAEAAQIAPAEIDEDALEAMAPAVEGGAKVDEADAA
jgi:hypothetical protein